MDSPESDRRGTQAPSRPLDYWLRPWQFHVLVGYYLVLLSGGTIISATVLLWRSQPVMTRAIVGGVSCGTAANAAYYIRRVYKNAIQGRLQFFEASTARIAGTFLYLASRPLIAALLSTAAVVGLLVGLVTVSTSAPSVREGFVYSAILACFAVGYSAGAVLDRLDAGTYVSPETVQNALGIGKRPRDV